MAAAASGKHLSRRLLIALFAVSAALSTAMAIAVTAMCYHTTERDSDTALATQAEDIAGHMPAGTPEEEAAWFSALPFGEMRGTLIAADGTVLYDSQADASTMENHNTRSEVVSAREKGEATVSRYSTTLGTDTLYAAVALPDGTVVRVGETRHSLTAFLGKMSPAVLAGLLVGVFIAFVVAQLLTRRIMKPFEEVGLVQQPPADMYVEMQPLLDRINEQRQELVKSNQELRRAANARREFTGNVTHEMKSPLQVIGGYAELMRDGIANPEDYQRFAGLICDEAQSMRALVDDVLTLSHLDEGSIMESGAEPVDLVQVAKHVATRLHPKSIDNGVTVRVDGPAEVIVQGNAGLLEQMLYNLVDNAIRYCGGERGQVVIRLRQNADWTTVSVDDNGPGVPVEARERVFERFYRVDVSRSRETGGTGLGLAIVKHAAEAHNGTVRIETSSLGGASFVVTLPTHLGA